ncbi:hypothetical protein FNV43_RR26405 [Rhamnella rubrinervis]|uniref:Uncharacterized protein n=1 Tax=Rhamnella rubrinervis TaxID=2594499 RepID=A0A8K0DP89_9ROSA|nr:hypothetical protein FNV43_RR26405 [Rhamnella rubrinervis]
MSGHTNQVPQPSGGWPLFGHLFLLGGQVPVYRTLGALAGKHGPIFQIKLGTKRVIVVSSWEYVKECLGTNDQVFHTRPTSAVSRYLGCNADVFGLSPYGPYWHHIRKIVSLELLSNRRVELLKDLRASEVDNCIKDLYFLCTKSKEGSSAMLDISRWFSTVTHNIMVRMLAGKRYSTIDIHEDQYKESQRFLKAIHDFICLFGVPVISYAIPCTEWLDLQGHVRSMKRVAKELDFFMTGWLEERLQNRKFEGDKQGRDFIDAMLSLMPDLDASFPGRKAENVIKATAVTLIIAGTDTTYLALNWALSLLLNHVKVLKTVQEELDTHVGKERWVDEGDMKNLVYLQAVIKEALRLYPSGPLAVPHEAIEDCKVAGYYVPKGTRLLINIWKLHRDPRVWTDPEEFKPERFLSTHADLDVRGQNFAYIPFSSGRRKCPGISSAMQVLPLTLGRLIQGFNITTPLNQPVDMTEGLAMTIDKANPVHVLLSPRLPHALYQP